MKRVTDPMRRIDLWLLLAATIALVVLGGPKFLKSTSAFARSVGLGQGAIVRKQPLAAPIAITGVQGLTIGTDKTTYTLAGLILPEDPDVAARTGELIRTATAQGIEVIRTVTENGAALIRCEPRVWHTCGNDSVRAHFEQMNLNELILAFGFATLDEQAAGLTHAEAIRLKAARDVGIENRRGMWSDSPLKGTYPFTTRWGLNIRDAQSLKWEIAYRAEELAKAAASAAEIDSQHELASP